MTTLSRSQRAIYETAMRTVIREAREELIRTHTRIAELAIDADEIDAAQRRIAALQFLLKHSPS